MLTIYDNVKFYEHHRLPLWTPRFWLVIIDYGELPSALKNCFIFILKGQMAMTQRWKPLFNSLVMVKVFAWELCYFQNVNDFKCSVSTSYYRWSGIVIRLLIHLEFNRYRKISLYLKCNKIIGVMRTQIKFYFESFMK